MDIFFHKRSAENGAGVGELWIAAVVAAGCDEGLGLVEIGLWGAAGPGILIPPSKEPGAM